MDRSTLEKGIALFNDAQFFEAHEVWESAWRASFGDDKKLLQGLIQAAAAFVKWQRREPVGFGRLLTTAIDKLYGFEGETHGVLLAPFVESLVSIHERSKAAVAEKRTPSDLFSWPQLGYAAPSRQADRAGDTTRFISQQCPYCGESVELTVDGVGAVTEQYVEDCSVCCRPWAVHISREGGEVDVTLRRDDD